MPHLEKGACTLQHGPVTLTLTALPVLFSIYHLMTCSNGRRTDTTLHTLYIISVTIHAGIIHAHTCNYYDFVTTIIIYERIKFPPPLFKIKIIKTISNYKFVITRFY